MSLSDLTEWLDKYSGPEYVWFAKRLSAYETLANNLPNSGPRLPEMFLSHLNISPGGNDTRDRKLRFELSVDSHGVGSARVRGVCGKFGGMGHGLQISDLDDARSPLLDPENTGALAIFVFVLGDPLAEDLRAWVCRNEAEEEVAECRIGPVEPGSWVVRSEQAGLLTGLPDGQALYSTRPYRTQ